MRHFTHAMVPPPSIVAAHRANPHPLDPREAWDDFDSRELREHLWELQQGLCAYCERVMEPGPGGSSIDHIQPKSQNPHLTFAYTNLILCCPDPATCNIHKRSHYFAGTTVTGAWTQGFIDPTQPRCEAAFKYLANGRVETTGVPQDDADKTIGILNLNQQDLVTNRRDYLGALDTAIGGMTDQLDALEDYLRGELSVGGLKPYFSAKKQLYGRYLPA